MSVHLNGSRRVPASSSSQDSRRDWQPVPHINQLEPRGATKDYANGPYNCAAAVVAMVARGWDRMGGMSDARLIQELGKGLVTPQGTTPDGLVRMLERADVKLGGKAMGSTYEDAVAHRQLERGHMLVAQVGTVDPKTGEVSPHYVLVRKALSNGNYLVSDPLSKKPYEVTPQQLQAAVRKAPPDGGMLIPISRPGGSKERAGPPSETYEKPARGSRDADAARANSRAFTVSSDVFEDVDTRFRKQHGPLNGAMRRNEAENEWELDVSYSKSPYNPHRNGQDKPVVPEDESALEFARRLLRHKCRGNANMDKVFSWLEASKYPKDQQVLEHIRRGDVKHPGIGKKITIEA